MPPAYEYLCERCGKELEIVKPMSEYNTIELCNECNTIMIKQVSKVAVTGTQDSFGIGNAFCDEKTGKTIDTWKKWEKAGYRDAEDVVPSRIKNEVRRKKEKVTQYDTKSKFSVGGK